jgi:hypothetical protein
MRILKVMRHPRFDFIERYTPLEFRGSATPTRRLQNMRRLSTNAALTAKNALATALYLGADGVVVSICDARTNRL